MAIVILIVLIVNNGLCSSALILNDPGVCLIQTENGNQSYLSCCADYKLVDNGNRCEACPNGTRGRGCSKVCMDGYYGYLCKSKCICAGNEICNKINGCQIEDNSYSSGSSDVTVPVVVVIVLIVLLTALAVVCWKKHLFSICTNIGRPKLVKFLTEVFLSRTSEPNPEHEDVYAEIRESMMVDLDPNSPRIKSTYGDPVDQMFHQSNNVYNKPID